MDRASYTRGRFTGQEGICHISWWDRELYTAGWIGSFLACVGLSSDYVIERENTLANHLQEISPHNSHKVRKPEHLKGLYPGGELSFPALFG